MGRVVWKENKVLSIETKEGVFVLAQMLKSPYMIFFNCYEKQSQLVNCKPEKKDIMFFHAVTKQFLKKSNIETQSIQPVLDYDVPKLWLKEDLESRSLRLWENTVNEIEIVVFGENGAKLIEKNILGLESFNLEETQKQKITSNYIKEDTGNIFDEYELTSVEVYPNLNERLYLCYKMGRNIDPAKDILFNKDLPLDYRDYVKIISGRVLLSDLGY